MSPGTILEVDRGSRPRLYRITPVGSTLKMWFTESELQPRENLNLEKSENEAKVPTQQLLQSRGTRGKGRVRRRK